MISYTKQIEKCENSIKLGIKWSLNPLKAHDRIRVQNFYDFRILGNRT